MVIFLCCFNHAMHWCTRCNLCHDVSRVKSPTSCNSNSFVNWFWSLRQICFGLFQICNQLFIGVYIRLGIASSFTILMSKWCKCRRGNVTRTWLLHCFETLSFHHYPLLEFQICYPCPHSWTHLKNQLASFKLRLITNVRIIQQVVNTRWMKYWLISHEPLNQVIYVFLLKNLGENVIQHCNPHYP
jgi:hypothetical protein